MMEDEQRPGAAGEAERALLRRMAAGDELALAALYDRWASRVHGVAFCILRDEDEAEDVVEETFWQAWRSAASYDWRRASFATWLLMIARSRALDRARRGRRRAERLAAADPAGASTDGPGTPEAEDPVRHARLAAALAALPEEQREVVQLAFFGGLSHSEIATRLDRPLGTVKTRIRLAMQKLRERLAFLDEARE